MFGSVEYSFSNDASSRGYQPIFLETLNLKPKVLLSTLVEKSKRLWRAFHWVLVENMSFVGDIDRALAAGIHVMMADEEHSDDMKFADCVRFILEKWAIFLTVSGYIGLSPAKPSSPLI